MNQTYMAIYDVVKQIPKGKVATYGQIAKLVGNKNLSRTVGNALHANPDADSIPCHRVVRFNGCLAENYAFGGVEQQKEKLLLEGVSVENNKVNLSRYQWQNESTNSCREGEV